jgi:hypothetical protein
MRISITILIFLLFAQTSFGQIGGNHVFQFLDLPQTAAIGGLGGNMVARWDKDIQISEQNPAFLHSEHSNQFNFNYIGYLHDIRLMSALYAYDIPSYGTFSFAIFSADYGDFTETDAYGNQIGSFRASETAYQLAWGYPISEHLQIGTRLKLVNSLLANYFSTGFAGDVGIVWHPNADFSAALVAKNMGFQVKNYYVNAPSQSLPFEIEFALSQKLKHAPFRLHFSYQHLEQFNLLYDDPSDPNSYLNPLTGETVSKSKIELVANNLFRHLTAGIEFIPTENFYFDLGFNAQRRYELRIEEKMGTVGFSWGFGLKISKFKVSFARAIYHLAGGSNHFSLTTNLSDFYRKKQSLN